MSEKIKKKLIGTSRDGITDEKFKTIFKKHGLEEFVGNETRFLKSFDTIDNKYFYISLKTFGRDFVYNLYLVYNDFMPLLHLNPSEAHIEFLERARLLLVDIYQYMNESH